MKVNVIFLEPTIMPNWFEDFGDSRKYYGSSLTRVPNPPKGPGIIRKLSDIFFTVWCIITFILSWFQDIPFDECMIYMITYAWLIMAEIVRSPFDGDRYYDIDIVRRIDSELFEASAALHLWKIKCFLNIYLFVMRGLATIPF